MLMTTDAAASSPSSFSSSAAQTTCGNCGVEEPRLLHHVRHRGTFRRLCTTCVLRLHPQSFCPRCFVVYNSSSSPPSTPKTAVTCSKCYSSSHVECVGSAHPGPYVCPLCVSPNAPIFAPKKVKDLVNENPAAADALKDAASGEYRILDKENAKILLAAAKISAVSMNKAAVAARAEAERRAKDAAFTRKRAIAALEHVAYLVARENLKKKERLEPVGGGSNRVTGGGAGVMVRNSGNRSNVSVGNVNPAAVRLGLVREGNGVGNATRGDGSNDVLAALNAVELREGEKMGGQSNAGLGQRLNNAVPMEVEENGRVETKEGMNDGRAVGDYHGGAGVSVDNISNHGVAGETVSNGHVSVLPLPRENNQPVEQTNNVSGH